jgi:hypothetical protein
MRAIEQSLAAWKVSLCDRLDMGGLYSRSPIAHKWKAPFRSLTLRETVGWRAHDLLQQSLLLHDHGHLLGARVLLRSAFETVAILIYLNQITRSVLAGKIDFHDFSEKTSTLLLGSRDGSTNHKALNIVTVLSKCNSRYPGIESLHARLSESAHSNYEGTCIGYSDVDRDADVTRFSNKWKTIYGAGHIDSIELCMNTFFNEYNDEWHDAFVRLEEWIESNDEHLEKTKRGI